MPIEKQFSDDLVAGAAVRDGEGNIISSTYAPATAIPNPDWNEEDSSSKDYIKNKPIWLETTTLSSEKMEFPPPYWVTATDRYFGELAIINANVHLELTEGETYYLYQDDTRLLSATASTAILDDETVFTLNFIDNNNRFLMIQTNTGISETGEAVYNPESILIMTSKSLYDMFKEDYFDGNHLYYLGMVDGYVKNTHHLPLSYINFKDPSFQNILQQILLKSNWDEEDEASSAYIKNRPFYKETVSLSNNKINIPSPIEFFSREEYNTTNYYWTGEMSLSIDPNETYYFYANNISISSATPSLWDSSKPEEDSYVLTFQTDPSSGAGFVIVTNRELSSTMISSPYKSGSAFILTNEDTFNAYRDAYLQGNTASIGNFSGTRAEYHKIPTNYIPEYPGLFITSTDISNWNNKQDTLTIDTAMSDSSTNPVQNSIIKSYVDTTVGSINTILATLASIGGGS